MARKVIDCREYPSVNNCTIAMAADTSDELLELAVLHASSAHDHPDTPELRDQLRLAIKESALT
jgi:predicted small metal-binding protein